MKKFVFVYYGGMTPDNADQEAAKKSMEAWMAWFKDNGSVFVDMGAPFGPGMSVSAAEAAPIAADMWPAKGYSVVEATDMDAAVALAQTNPGITDNEKDFAVRVYEAMPM